MAGCSFRERLCSTEYAYRQINDISSGTSLSLKHVVFKAWRWEIKIFKVDTIISRSWKILIIKKIVGMETANCMR